MATTVGPPAQIRLEASSFCNLRCPLCGVTSGEIYHHSAVGGGFLQFEDFRKLLDNNPGLKRIELSNNGEIFLNPALLSILELAHERGVELKADGAHFNTVRPEVLEGLVKYQFRTLVCSIDGASEETYSIYRVRGKFSNVIDNIRKINELKQRYDSPFPALHWKFIVFGHNEHELPVAREMARELGMSFVTQMNRSPDYSPVRDPEFVRANGAVVSNDEYGALHGHHYYQYICHQLWDDPQINWDGKVLGCCINSWGDFGGNAFRDGLTASVNTEQIQHARAMLIGLAPPREDIPCTQCEVYQGMRERGRWLERAGTLGGDIEINRQRRQFLLNLPSLGDLETSE